MTQEEFYQDVLGLQWPWRVSRVVLDRRHRCVDVWLSEEPGARWRCPRCGQERGLYDHSEERAWRHLDTCEFTTHLHARPPRVSCPRDGVVQVDVPWAEGDCRHTMAMEKRGVDVLKECDVSGGGRLLRLGWSALWGLMERAVRRGRARKGRHLPAYVGVDEKSFAKRHCYETVVCNLEAGTVEEVTDDRKQESLQAYLQSFPLKERRRVKAVAMDMWDPYIAAVREALPKGEGKIVFDRYHVVGQVSKALDTVRRQESRELEEAGDTTLKGTRYLWLWNEENIPERRRPDFECLRRKDLKVSRAWAIKENLRRLWHSRTVNEARNFFAGWYGWAVRSRLAPVVKAARTLKSHLGGVVAFFKHRITNACVEGINSKIETIKKMACGFRNRENYKTAIYFHCSGLDLYPRVRAPVCRTALRRTQHVGATHGKP